MVSGIHHYYLLFGERCQCARTREMRGKDIRKEERNSSLTSRRLSLEYAGKA